MMWCGLCIIRYSLTTFLLIIVATLFILCIMSRSTDTWSRYTCDNSSPLHIVNCSHVVVCRQHVWMDSFTRYLCWHLYEQMEYWCSDQYTVLYPGNIWSTQGTKPFSCTRKHYHHLIILCNHATICSMVRGGDNEEKYISTIYVKNGLCWIDNMDVYFYIYLMDLNND